jgi:hypothetical protein
MAFNRAGFTQAAKAMGYSDDEINQIATMKESQAGSPANQLQDIQLQQAQLNLKQDQKASLPQTPQEKVAMDYADWQKKEEYKAKQSKLGDIYKTAQLEDKQKGTFQSLFTQLDDLKQQAKDTSVLDIPGSIIGANPKMKNFEMAKALAAQQIAKLAEYGKTTGGRGISDKDREFYQKLVSGINAIGLQGPIEAQVESLKKSIATLAGYKPEELTAKPLPPIGNSKFKIIEVK